MIPWIPAAGEPAPRTYREFQDFSVALRECSLKWLRGRTDRTEIVMDMITMNRAANDPWPEDIGKLVAHYEFVMMLYCWVENGRDDVRAKLAYVQGRDYGPTNL